MIMATEDDRPAIEAFLTSQVETSMFPLSNLARYGMGGGNPRAVSFWVRWLAGEISDVLTVTDEGMLFPQCPNGPWGDVAAVVAGTCVKGVLGEAEQVRAVKTALRLPSAQLDTVEPLYWLDLANLDVPDTAGFDLAPIQTAPHELIVTWRAAYNVESLAIPGEDAVAQAERDLAAYAKVDSHRILMQGDVPVAMTGFNASLPHCVQIGGVYTPPEMRSRGYARLALALHLQQARATGVKTAILFAANEAAERAYQAIGFRRIGRFAISVYAEPQVIHG